MTFHKGTSLIIFDISSPSFFRKGDVGGKALGRGEVRKGEGGGEGGGLYLFFEITDSEIICIGEEIIYTIFLDERF